MPSWLHIAVPPAPALFAQLLIGLINGSFYALLSLGLAIIFGLLNIINFTHGAQYMMGAFWSWFLLNWLGIGYWPSLIVAPIVVGALGIAIERLLLRHIARLDHLYGLLLTFGLALIIEGVFRQRFGSSGLPYTIPPPLCGGGAPGAVSALFSCRSIAAGSSCSRSASAWRPGLSSSARGWARSCAPRPR